MGTDPVARDSEPLFLTPNRSSQQDGYDKKKQKLRGKLFVMRSRPPVFCKRYPVAFFKYQDGKIVSVTYRYQRCNSWTCPNCAPIKASHVMNVIKEVVILNDMKFFLTLTLDPATIPFKYKDSDDNQTHKFITKIFNTFLTNIRREERDFRYVWVIEFQKKTGNAHMHIVFNTRLDIVNVRNIWTRIGGGMQSRVMQINDLISVAAYISKYIVKDIKEGNFGNLHHFERRYCISRSCIRPKISKAKPFLPNAKPSEIREELKKQNCVGVYNTLLSGNFVDGEEVKIIDKSL